MRTPVTITILFMFLVSITVMIMMPGILFNHLLAHGPLLFMAFGRVYPVWGLRQRIARTIRIPLLS